MASLSSSSSLVPPTRVSWERYKLDLNRMGVVGFYRSELNKMMDDEFELNCKRSMAKYYDVELDGPVPKTPACGAVVSLKNTVWKKPHTNTSFDIYDAPPRPLSDLMSDPSKRLRCSLLDLDLNYDIWSRIWPSERVLMACSVSKALRDKVVGFLNSPGTAKAVNIQLGFSHFPTFQILDRSDPYAHLKLFWPPGQFRVVPWVTVVGHNGQRERMMSDEDVNDGYYNGCRHVTSTLDRLECLEKRVHVVGWKRQMFLDDLVKTPQCLPNYDVRLAQQYGHGCMENEVKKYVCTTLQRALAHFKYTQIGKQLTELRVSILLPVDLKGFLDDFVPNVLDYSSFHQLEQCRKVDFLLPMLLHSARGGDLSAIHGSIYLLQLMFAKMVHKFESVTLRLQGWYCGNLGLVAFNNLPQVFSAIGKENCQLVRYFRVQFPWFRWDVSSKMVQNCLGELSHALYARDGFIEHVRIAYQWDEIQQIRDLKEELAQVFDRCEVLELELLNERYMMNGEYLGKMDVALQRMVEHMRRDEEKDKQLIVHVFERDDFQEIDVSLGYVFGGLRTACAAKGVLLRFQRHEVCQVD